jgi:hypothetical protein
MKRSTVFCLAMLVLVAAGSAHAQGELRQPRAHGVEGMSRPGGPGGGAPGGPPPFERHLFPPDLVLHNQLALGLSEEQLTGIKRLLKETQGRVVELQADLARVTERLGGILAPSRVDEAAALSASDEAMRLESFVKREHLALLVRVKNLLTEEQQETLRNLRPPRRED